MSRPTLTLVAGFRDREIPRLERWLDSLSTQTFRGFSAILVDYGSARPVAEAARAAVERRGFCRYVYSDTRGRPWSRSCALNIGGRLAKSDYLLTTDIDMVFPPEFLAAAMARAGDGRLVHAWCTFLPRGFDDWANVAAYRDLLPAAATRRALGGCQCLPLATFHEICGFDEYYQYWGVEDRDLADRLETLGLEESEVPDRLPMFHQWHPAGNDKVDDWMPAGLWARMNDHYRRHQGRVERNAAGWGGVLLSGNRAALEFLDLERLRLVERPELHLLDVRPDRPRETAQLVEALWDLAPGHALAVDHAFFPHRSGLSETAVRTFNSISRRFGSRARIGHPINRLHTALVELIESHADRIADYYLGFPARNGVSLIVRGEAPSS